MMITIIDYGVGNITSLRNAFAALEVPVTVSQDRREIAAAEKLVLPGVGAFAPAMQRLRELSLDQIILEKSRQHTPLLGICLGMQLLFTTGYEQGQWPGLNLISGQVRRFENVDKIPHMGWNQVQAHPVALFSAIRPMPYFYFVHSYYCVPEDAANCIATCDYGTPFCAAVQKDKIWGVQFHPEKSQVDGLKLLQSFASM